jgi:hypothetical protein
MQEARDVRVRNQAASRMPMLALMFRHRQLVFR